MSAKLFLYRDMRGKILYSMCNKIIKISRISESNVTSRVKWDHIQGRKVGERPLWYIQWEHALFSREFKWSSENSLNRPAFSLHNVPVFLNNLRDTIHLSIPQSLLYFSVQNNCRIIIDYLYLYQIMYLKLAKVVQVFIPHGKRKWWGLKAVSSPVKTRVKLLQLFAYM